MIPSMYQRPAACSLDAFIREFFMWRGDAASPLQNAGQWSNMASGGGRWGHSQQLQRCSPAVPAERRAVEQHGERGGAGRGVLVAAVQPSAACTARPAVLAHRCDAALPSLAVQASWYPRRGNDDVLWLHYEDLHADRHAAVRLIADFLGIGVDDAGAWGVLRAGRG